jgi:hypothetical protein
MTLKDLIERGYFPKELPPPFDTVDLAADIATILSSWNTVFENNTQVNSATFILTQSTGETPKQFKDRKKAHKADFNSKYNSSKATVYSILKGKLSRRFLQLPNPKHYSIYPKKLYLDGLILKQYIAFQTTPKVFQYLKSLLIKGLYQHLAKV